MSYLHYDSFVGETTPIDNCYKLLPSEYLIFNISNKTIQKKKYWDINIHSEKKKLKIQKIFFFKN